MPVLQKNPIPNRDVLNRVKRYHQYVLTIPADISRQARLSEGQTVFAHAIKRDSRIALETAHPTNTHAVETSIRIKRTRTYKGMPCFVTQIIVPMNIVRALHLKKGQQMNFQMYNNTIIISQ